jgi:hypothetical protein
MGPFKSYIKTKGAAGALIRASAPSKWESEGVNIYSKEAAGPLKVLGRGDRVYRKTGDLVCACVCVSVCAGVSVYYCIFVILPPGSEPNLQGDIQCHQRLQLST